MSYIKKAYYYIFYKFYRLFESGVFSAWWSDTKASIYMDALLIFLLFTMLFYYKVFIDRYLDLSIITAFIIVGIPSIIGFNYYLFDYKDKWKKIVKEFDKLPKRKNKIGSWLVFLFVCLVFFNLFNSFYLMSQIDWSQYR